MASKKGWSQINATVLLLNLPKPDQGWALQQSQGVSDRKPRGVSAKTLSDKKTKKKPPEQINLVATAACPKLIQRTHLGSSACFDSAGQTLHRVLFRKGPRYGSYATVGPGPGWLRLPRQWRWRKPNPVWMCPTVSVNQPQPTFMILEMYIRLI